MQDYGCQWIPRKSEIHLIHIQKMKIYTKPKNEYGNGDDIIRFQNYAIDFYLDGS